MDCVHTHRWCEALIERGFEVKCFSLEPFEGDRSYGVYLKPRLRPAKLRYISSFDMVGRAVRAFAPDVVVPIHFPNYGLVSWLMRVDAPVYLVGWGSDILHAAEKSFVHKWITRQIVHHADWLNVDAEIMRTYLVDRYDISSATVDLITWGLPANWYEKPISPPPDGPPWKVICHRRLDYDMNPILLLEGFEQSVERGFDGILSIKGHGPWADRVRSWVDEHRLGDRVEYLPWMDYDELRDVIAEHHIYVTSAWVDSTSVSLLEIMSQGNYPVVTDIPANREWVIHEHNGLLFHPQSPRELADMLLHVQRNPAWISEARPLNRPLVERKASWDIHMDTVAASIRRVAGRPVPDAAEVLTNA
jgi:glycosyltransferase involved in cell wall biosynthesis